MKLRLQVRDHTLAVLASVADYQEADVVTRHLGLGSWRVLLPEDTEAGKLLMVRGSGIVADVDGTRVLSGPTTRIRRTRTGRGRRRLEVSGVSDAALAWRRTAWPVPTAALSAQSSAYDVRTGHGETVMRGFVAANMGPTATRTEARIPALVLGTDGGRGATVTASARFDRLGDLLVTLGLRAGLGWDIVQQGTSLVWSVYEIRDRTRHAVFSDALRNLDDYDLSDGWPEVTRAIVGGGGEGAARIFRDRRDTAAEARWHTYSEQFVDQRQTTATAELDQAGDEALATGASPQALSATVRDTPSCAWGTAWRLGDRVTVWVGEAPYIDTVQQVLWEARPGQALRPRAVIGAQDAQDSRYAPVLDFFRRLDAADRKRAALERST